MFIYSSRITGNVRIERENNPFARSLDSSPETYRRLLIRKIWNEIN